MEITADAEQATIEGGQPRTATDTVPAGATGKISINGAQVEIREGENFQAVYEKLRDTAELGGAKLLVVADITDRTGEPENAGYVPEILQMEEIWYLSPKITEIIRK